MPRSGRLRVSVASFAASGLASPFINCSTKLSVPTVPGETSTWNIAFSVWIWIASGVTAAASARGGGVKRQPATTNRIAATTTTFDKDRAR